MAKQTPLLRTALRRDSHLQKHVKKGTSAFDRRDLALVAESERSRIGDSLDLDAATQPELPNENRWDYVLSLPDLSEIVGIEPHAAKDSEIGVVIAKKKNAVQYLQGHFCSGHRVKRWFWVSHGRVGFSRMDRARRRLDQNGILFVSRILRTFR